MIEVMFLEYPDSKVHGANMGPIWGRQESIIFFIIHMIGMTIHYVSIKDFLIYMPIIEMYVDVSNGFVSDDVIIILYFLCERRY